MCFLLFTKQAVAFVVWSCLLCVSKSWEGHCSPGECQYICGALCSCAMGAGVTSGTAPGVARAAFPCCSCRVLDVLPQGNSLISKAGVIRVREEGRQMGDSGCQLGARSFVW